jgi:type IV pilus assembly protein PilV
MARQTRHQQRGVTLIEVMVTVLVLSIGLLGMAALQARLQKSEVEAYQRSQALLLLSDMANRLAVNRSNAAGYPAAISSVGAGMNCPTSSATLLQQDASEWCRLLQGASERLDGSSVGTLLGGRGCVEQLSAGEYLITVAWQGLTPLTAPPAGVACGSGSYNGTGGCSDDRCRRVVTTVVRVVGL